jgi:hypothetical protein
MIKINFKILYFVSYIKNVWILWFSVKKKTSENLSSILEKFENIKIDILVSFFIWLECQNMSK